MRQTKDSNRIVLAYSGSTNTTVAIPWLAERYDAEVVTVTLDLDQRTGLEATRDRALAAGAVRAHVVEPATSSRVTSSFQRCARARSPLRAT